MSWLLLLLLLLACSPGLFLLAVAVVAVYWLVMALSAILLVIWALLFLLFSSGLGVGQGLSLLLSFLSALATVLALHPENWPSSDKLFRWMKASSE